MKPTLGWLYSIGLCNELKSQSLSKYYANITAVYECVFRKTFKLHRLTPITLYVKIIARQNVSLQTLNRPLVYNYTVTM